MLRIINGEVYDPTHQVNGQKKDIYIKDGKIVEGPLPDAKTIDASDCFIMAGGVEIHTHVSGPKVNYARLMRPEDHRYDVIKKTDITRSGVGGATPSTFVTGYRYCEMGYTTIFEAAVPPLSAKHAHEEMNDIHQVDKGMFALMGNNHIIMKYIEANEHEKVRDYIAWLINASRAYSVKIVNPGGVENWKWGGNIHSLDEKVKYFNVTPRQIITHICQAMTELKLPHPLHLHANNLGLPDNHKTIIETVNALNGLPVHLTHLQFSSYGAEGKRKFSSAAPKLAELINQNKNVTIDVGQVIFGHTTTITADGPFEYRLSQMSHGAKWFNGDVECEDGCGVVPYDYKQKSFVNSVQWAIGLELFLLIDDPWRVYLTTDHPNAGPFTSYPYIIHLLMDKDFRKEEISKIHKAAQAEIPLKVLEREYSLYEIAIITRAGTAKTLGLKNKGHLGVGADADVAVYRKGSNIEEMFALPAYVIKDGEIVARDGTIVKEYPGRTFYVEPHFNDSIIPEIADFFNKYYTIQFVNYSIPHDFIPKHEVIPCE